MTIALERDQPPKLRRSDMFSIPRGLNRSSMPLLRSGIGSGLSKAIDVPLLRSYPP
jgi:hypothetical protein